MTNATPDTLSAEIVHTTDGRKMAEVDREFFIRVRDLENGDRMDDFRVVFKVSAVRETIFTPRTGHLVEFTDGSSVSVAGADAWILLEHGYAAYQLAA
jgi:hypothetical protein